MTSSTSHTASTGWMRAAGLTVSLLWALIWTVVAIASGAAEGLTLDSVLIHGILPFIFFAGSTLLAWRLRDHGGGVLVGAGAAVFVLYPLIFGPVPFSTLAFVLLTMALPPILAGTFLILHARPRAGAGT